MSRIVGVAGALPSHRHRQAEVTEVLEDVVLGADADPARHQLLHRLHAAAGVGSRYLAQPLDEYGDLDFGGSNAAFIDIATALGTEAVEVALDEAGLTGADVDLVLVASTTGMAAPSLDARIAPRVGLRPDVKRLPVFGLGCVAGAAGIARLHDYLEGHPDDIAVPLSVELCSLTFQHDDDSTANLVATGLFGDGAGAVVMAGDRRAGILEGAGPRVVATRSRLYPDTERVMGWDIGGSGFRIVLAATVADVVEKYLRDDVDAFLADFGLSIAEVDTWVAHPGGPKVIEAITRTLDLSDDALAVTRRSLASIGNVSSASVLHVLRDTLRENLPTPGAPGVLMALGPGFCAELVLLQW